MGAVMFKVSNIESYPEIRNDSIVTRFVLNGINFGIEIPNLLPREYINQFVQSQLMRGIDKYICDITDKVAESNLELRDRFIVPFGVY